jgi:hypothetical protein
MSELLFPNSTITYNRQFRFFGNVLAPTHLKIGRYPGSLDSKGAYNTDVQQSWRSLVCGNQ